MGLLSIPHVILLQQQARARNLFGMAWIAYSDQCPLELHVTMAMPARNSILAKPECVLEPPPLAQPLINVTMLVPAIPPLVLAATLSRLTVCLVTILTHVPRPMLVLQVAVSVEA